MPLSLFRATDRESVMSEKRKSGGKTAKVDLALAKECMDKRLAIGATLANFLGRP